MSPRDIAVRVCNDLDLLVWVSPSNEGQASIPIMSVGGCTP